MEIKFTDLQTGDKFKSTNPELPIIGTVIKRKESNNELWRLIIEYDDTIISVDSHDFVWNKNVIKIVDNGN